MGVEKVRRPILAPAIGPGGIEYRFAEVSITIAEMKAIRGTPKTVVPAPGAGKALLFLSAALIYDYAAVYGETSDNLVFRLTNGSGPACSDVIEATGFIDQTSDQMRNAVPVKDVALASNAPIVLHNNGDGEFTGTGSPVRVRVAYAVFNTGL